MDIKSVIRKYGFTVNSLATKHGIGQSRLNQMVNGNPSAKNLEWLASLIGCSPAEFFADWQGADADVANHIDNVVQPQSSEPLGKQDDLPFSRPDGGQQPTAVMQQAVICPHCHQALIFNIASYEQK